MRLPAPRGPITALLFDHLPTGPHALPPAPPAGPDDPFQDEDLQLALFACYEIHYRGFDNVPETWEWHPSLIAFRTRLEDRFERRLGVLVPPRVGMTDVPGALARLVETADGPSLATFVQREATLEQFREFVRHRSIYQLKEADPHSWAIPRLSGPAKAALVEIQADEYGGGRPELMHAELFRTTMRGLGLDDTYGAYLDVVPAITLAVNNLMSFFGLHRRRIGALVGHLAAFEMTSSQPNRRYSAGLARLGADRTTRRFYDEHVQADAVHEQLAAHDLAGRLAAQRPELAADVIFGAASCLAVERLFAEHLLACWSAGSSSLRSGRTAVRAPAAG
ncbi:iron-containing redox enzyme family protein [Actinoallomurus sp. CA-142502]|uniref:iron-containing redox enzyme family protein n=1 Tax=Actinoallomurus sp. CA-142502 TaxID=3239885 RepID=UPI003D91D17B